MAEFTVVARGDHQRPWVCLDGRWRRPQHVVTRSVDLSYREVDYSSLPPPFPPRVTHYTFRTTITWGFDDLTQLDAGYVTAYSDRPSGCKVWRFTDSLDDTGGPL